VQADNTEEVLSEKALEVKRMLSTTKQLQAKT
jgi:hypothetical protein